MELIEIQKKALDIRNKYSELEQRKYGRKWTSAEIMEGFVGDVGQLMKLVMCKSGIRQKDNVDAELAHELSDCLYCVLVLAHEFNVDIEAEFLETMKSLVTRINNTK
jgi:NTP pyrophosphatase (non-canonical NTP hydrolase)